MVTKREMDGLRPKGHAGTTRRMPRIVHSGNQEFGPLTPPIGKRRRRIGFARYPFIWFHKYVYQR